MPLFRRQRRIHNANPPNIATTVPQRMRPRTVVSCTATPVQARCRCPQWDNNEDGRCWERRHVRHEEYQVTSVVTCISLDFARAWALLIPAARENCPERI